MCANTILHRVHAFGDVWVFSFGFLFHSNFPPFSQGDTEGGWGCVVWCVFAFTFAFHCPCFTSSRLRWCWAPFLSLFMVVCNEYETESLFGACVCVIALKCVYFNALACYITRGLRVFFFKPSWLFLFHIFETMSFTSNCNSSRNKIETWKWHKEEGLSEKWK